MTPSMEQLVRLRPNAKGDTYMSDDRKHIVYRFKARLGKHGVVNEGEPPLWETEEEALDAAKRFRSKVREALKK